MAKQTTLTVFDLITAHISKSAQSSNSGLQITACVVFIYFFIKAYVVGTHLNCIDLSMQFKWVPTTYALRKKIREKYTHKTDQYMIYQIALYWKF